MIQQLRSSSLTYIPSSLIGVMTISRWCHRPTDVTTIPLRDHWEQPRFYIFPSLFSSSRSSSSRPSQLLRALYLFRKLNGRVLSHSCGYSFRQRAWPSFRDIRTSRISDRFAILERIERILLAYRSTRSSLSLYKISRLFRHFSSVHFSSPFSNIIFFLFFFLFIGLLVLGNWVG